MTVAFKANRGLVLAAYLVGRSVATKYPGGGDCPDGGDLRRVAERIRALRRRPPPPDPSVHATPLYEREGEGTDDKSLVSFVKRVNNRECNENAIMHVYFYFIFMLGFSFFNDGGFFFGGAFGGSKYFISDRLCTLIQF